MNQPLTSGPAPRIEGVTPGSERIALAFPDSDVDLLFLTSDCRECRECWGRLAGGNVVVTPDPATDSRRSVAKLAPAGITVVMSSNAWHAYGITKAPWLVEVRAGEIVGSRPAV